MRVERSVTLSALMAAANLPKISVLPAEADEAMWWEIVLASMAGGGR